MIILAFFILISCQNKSNPQNGQIANDSIKSIQDRFLDANKIKSHIGLDFAQINDKINDSKNTLVIDKVCAVSISPDTNWVNNQQKTMSESDYNTVIMDNLNYESSAMDTLSKLNIPTIPALRNKKYIKFIKDNGIEYYIDLNKMIDAQGLILFNKIDNPVLWHSDLIDDELKEIYKK